MITLALHRIRHPVLLRQNIHAEITAAAGHFHIHKSLLLQQIRTEIFKLMPFHLVHHTRTAVAAHAADDKNDPCQKQGQENDTYDDGNKNSGIFHAVFALLPFALTHALLSSMQSLSFSSNSPQKSENLAMQIENT